MSTAASDITPAPCVSVIMIFHNARRFIASAIESVLAQTFEDWELILVDDAGVDGSREIADRYAAQHPTRIRTVQHAGHTNRGMSASRNLGIATAHGSLIAFLDADDEYLPEKLERQVALLEVQPEAAMVYGATLHWFSWSGNPEDEGRDFKRKLGVEPDTFVHPPRLVKLFLSHGAWPPGTCGVLIRRAAIDAVGGFEEQFRGMFEDQVFFYKLCLTQPVFIEDGSWDRYRQHPDSLTETMRATGQWSPGRHERSAVKAAFLRWFASYVAAQRIRDPELGALIQSALRPYDHPLRYAVAIRGRNLARRIQFWR